jgi:hypothetical protein
VLAERRFRIDLALHDVKFMVDRRKARFGFDQDQSIHAIGNVFCDHGRRTVVNVKAWNKRLERHGSHFGPRPSMSSVRPTRLSQDRLPQHAAA